MLACMEGDLGSYHCCGCDRRYLGRLARGYEDRSYRWARSFAHVGLIGVFAKDDRERKSITLSRRLIRLANDADWGILCVIVRLTKESTPE